MYLFKKPPPSQHGFIEHPPIKDYSEASKEFNRKYDEEHPKSKHLALRILVLFLVIGLIFAGLIIAGVFGDPKKW